MDNLSDTLASESLFTESPLDVVQDLCVDRVLLIQNVLELKVGRAKTVAEMLSEDPSTV